MQTQSRADQIDALLNAAAASISGAPSQEDAASEDEVAYEADAEYEADLEDGVDASEDEEATISLTVEESPRVKTVTPQEQMSQLLGELEEAETLDDITQLRIRISQMKQIINAAQQSSYVMTLDDLLSAEFKGAYTPAQILRSKEWTDFMNQKKFGSHVSTIYGNALMSGDTETLTEITREFAKSVGVKNAGQAKTKAPVTLPNRNSAPSQPNRKPALSVDKLSAQYFAAIPLVMSGRMPRPNFSALEAKYKAAIGR